MITAIDDILLTTLIAAPFKIPGPTALYREGRVFFVGGNLPILETVQTMHDSYCQESTDLLYLSFGDIKCFKHNLDMSRTVKKNFSVRLMGHIDRIVSGDEAEQLYLAGIDLLDVQQASEGQADREYEQMFNTFLKRAVSVFPRWSVSVSLNPGMATLDTLNGYARELLQVGVVPIVTLSEDNPALHAEEAKVLFQTIADQWRVSAVPIRHLQPILALSTPYVWREAGGMIRSAVTRFHNRQLLATSDLRRHLRTKAAEASFESAGL